MSAKRCDNAGLTLLEVMLAVALTGLLAGSVYETVFVGLRTAETAGDREDVRQQVTAALDLLTREAALASNVDNAEDQRLQFDADLDGNGSTENNIDYEVVSGDLQRIYNGTTLTLVRDLSALDFDYTDSGGSAMTTPVGSQVTRDTIRLMQITATATKDSESWSVANAVYLRNQ